MLKNPFLKAISANEDTSNSTQKQKLSNLYRNSNPNYHSGQNSAAQKSISNNQNGCLNHPEIINLKSTAYHNKSSIPFKACHQSSLNLSGNSPRTAANILSQQSNKFHQPKNSYSQASQVTSNAGLGGGVNNQGALKRQQTANQMMMSSKQQHQIPVLQQQTNYTQKNILSKKHLSISSANGNSGNQIINKGISQEINQYQQQTQALSSRHKLNQEVTSSVSNGLIGANIGFRKSSLQTQQPSSFNPSGSHLINVPTSSQPNNQKAIKQNLTNLNTSQENFSTVPSQRSNNENLNQLNFAKPQIQVNQQIFQTIETINGAKGFKQSRNIVLPKSSSAQNPQINRSQQSNQTDQANQNILTQSQNGQISKQFVENHQRRASINSNNHQNNQQLFQNFPVNNVNSTNLINNQTQQAINYATYNNQISTTQCETGASMDQLQQLTFNSNNQISSQSTLMQYPIHQTAVNNNNVPNNISNTLRPHSNLAHTSLSIMSTQSYQKHIPTIYHNQNNAGIISTSHTVMSKHELQSHPQIGILGTTQTDLMSMHSSLISDGNIGNTATGSLLEGSVTVHLPQSKITSAAARPDVQTSKKITKKRNSIKDKDKNPGKPQVGLIQQKSENISQSDHEYDKIEQNPQTRDLQFENNLRSTIIDKEVHQQEYDSDESILSKGRHQDNSDISSKRSQESPDGEGILPLLEGFIRKGELTSIKQFQCLIKGEIQKALIYRSIEHKQVQMLKYMLKDTLKLSYNLNLLHIACRQRDNSHPQRELDIVKTILKYDRFADVNSQDTYGNTPLHLAAQNGKDLVLEYILMKYNPNIYIKNSENQLALHSSTSQEILRIFVNHIQRMKENLNKQENHAQDNKLLNSQRSSKGAQATHTKRLSRNKSDLAYNESQMQKKHYNLNQEDQNQNGQIQNSHLIKSKDSYKIQIEGDKNYYEQNLKLKTMKRAALKNLSNLVEAGKVQQQSQTVSKFEMSANQSKNGVQNHPQKSEQKSRNRINTQYYSEGLPPQSTSSGSSSNQKLSQKRDIFRSKNHSQAAQNRNQIIHCDNKEEGGIQQYESIMDFCSREERKPASRIQTQNNNQQSQNLKHYLVFREDEFEKVVEFTESDEDGSSQCDNDENQNNINELMSCEYDDNLQLCDEIREVSEEEFQKQLRMMETKIGPKSFEPLSLLGQGSFGEVYLVRMKDTNQLYAMKVLQKQKIMGQNLVKYAITERNVLSYTRHPFIVGLNYAFQTRDKLFLILDYCPGGDLGKVITKERRLTEDRARVYLSEVLLALEDLHSRNIIFRDLKPDNVVLDEDGHALLTDFGLSKEGVLDNQASNSFCGSVAYLAPEMIRRSGHGKSVDWYLLGVLLYEMLVGIPPYFNQNREKLFQGISKGPLMIPAQFSDEAKTLLIGLLSKNPAKRLGSGLRGAEEIKEHPFFKNIDWVDVYHRKLTPPKPQAKDLKQLELPYEKMLEVLKQSVYGDQIDDENKVAGWSFACNDNLVSIVSKQMGGEVITRISNKTANINHKEAKQ